jgi:tetratricopeptide (TPR) repeat protein
MTAIEAAIALLLVQAQVPDNLGPAIRLYEAGEFQKAADLLRRAPASGRADLSLWLGKSCLRARKWDEAIAALEEAVKLQPSTSINHLWLGRAYGEKASRASALSAFGIARKVVREFETAVKLDPSNMDARFDLLEFYVEAPGIVGGGKDKATVQASAIAALNVRMGYTARARILEKEKQFDPARAELVKSTREFPAESEAFLDLAQFLIRRGEFVAAEASAARAVGLNPGSAGAAFALAICRAELRKDLAPAETSLCRLSAGSFADGGPLFEDVYFRLGQVRLLLSKRAEAREAFEKALRFNPEHAGAKAALAALR